MEVLNSLAPVFLLAALGVWMQKSFFLSETFFSAAGKLIYRVSLPALLFLKISKASFALEMGEAVKICIALLFGMFAAIPLSYCLAKMLKLQRESIGTFIQSSFRCNTAFVGLPVIIYALPSDTAVQLATLAIAPIIPLTNIAATFVLLSSSKSENIGSKGAFMVKAFVNPLVLACVAAIAYNACGFSLPVFAERSLSALGRTALPLALLGVGASMAARASFSVSRIVPPLVASMVNVIVLPILGYLACRAMGVGGDGTLIALIYLACPAASTSYALVQQLGGNQRLAADSIMISTVIAAPVLVIVLMLFEASLNAGG